MQKKTEKIHESTNPNNPNKPQRKRRNNKTNKVSIEQEILTKEKLREKLREKQTSRLSRHSRENIMEKLEEKIKESNGKDKIKYKKQLRELENIDEKEMQNAYERTIPDYD